jgi:uncharacterized Fe-S cluster-containing radical SAM superfamily enzyme
MANGVDMKVLKKVQALIGVDDGEMQRMLKLAQDVLPGKGKKKLRKLKYLHIRHHRNLNQNQKGERSKKN